jgi:hypothetical protein
VNLRRVPDTIGRERSWKIVSTATGLAGALVAKRLLRALYTAVRKESSETAFDPTKARFSWPGAVLWATAAGIGLVITKMVSDRVAAIGWEVATGTRPPGAGEEPAGA